MSSVSDYVGRTVDVLAFAGVKAEGEANLQASLLPEGSGGLVCTGIQKLAQAWLLEFMTEQGSVLYQKERGCPFMLYARLGRLNTELDVFQAFLLSKSVLAANLQRNEDGTEPDDERYVDCKLLSVEISPGVLSLKINLVSRAGTGRQIILPIDTVI